MKVKTQHPRGISYEPADRVFWANSFGLSEYQLGASSLSSQHWAGLQQPQEPARSIFGPGPHPSLASPRGVLPPRNPGGPVPISLLICFSTTRHCFPPPELNYHLVKVITLGRPTVAGGKQPAERWMKKMILTIWVRQWDGSGRASRSR